MIERKFGRIFERQKKTEDEKVAKSAATKVAGAIRNILEDGNILIENYAHQPLNLVREENWMVLDVDEADYRFLLPDGLAHFLQTLYRLLKRNLPKSTNLVPKREFIDQMSNQIKYYLSNGNAGEAGNNHGHFSVEQRLINDTSHTGGLPEIWLGFTFTRDERGLFSSKAKVKVGKASAENFEKSRRETARSAALQLATELSKMSIRNLIKDKLETIFKSEIEDPLFPRDGTSVDLMRRLTSNSVIENSQEYAVPFKSILASFNYGNDPFPVGFVIDEFSIVGSQQKTAQEMTLLELALLQLALDDKKTNSMRVESFHPADQNLSVLDITGDFYISVRTNPTNPEQQILTVVMTPAQLRRAVDDYMARLRTQERLEAEGVASKNRTKSEGVVFDNLASNIGSSSDSEQSGQNTDPEQKNQTHVDRILREITKFDQNFDTRAMGWLRNQLRQVMEENGGVPDLVNNQIRMGISRHLEGGDLIERIWQLAVIADFANGKTEEIKFEIPNSVSTVDEHTSPNSPIGYVLQYYIDHQKRLYPTRNMSKSTGFTVTFFDKNGQPASKAILFNPREGDYYLAIEETAHGQVLVRALITREKLASLIKIVSQEEEFLGMFEPEIEIGERLDINKLDWLDNDIWLSTPTNPLTKDMIESMLSQSYPQSDIRRHVLAAVLSKLVIKILGQEPTLNGMKSGGELTIFKNGIAVRIKTVTNQYGQLHGELQAIWMEDRWWNQEAMKATSNGHKPTARSAPADKP